jgi:hypothetical protein
VYRTVEGWAKLPDGRTWGATSAVYPAGDGNIWVMDGRMLRAASPWRLRPRYLWITAVGRQLVT